MSPKTAMWSLSAQLRFDFTTFPPFAAYGVEGWWLDNLLKSGKLTRATYLTLAARVTVGFQKRLADARAAERYEQEQAFEAAVKEALPLLQQQKWPMKDFEEVNHFIQLHTSGPSFRKPILVLVGGTRLGKSMLANDVLDRLANLWALEGFLEVTVEEDNALDMADFDRRVHSGVVLDGIGDALFLKRNREALQGRPKTVKGARSNTNVYAYNYSLYGRAVIATLDLSAHNLEAFGTDHWLSNPENVIHLHLTSPAYLPTVDLSTIPATPRSTQRPYKRRWIGSPARDADAARGSEEQG